MKRSVGLASFLCSGLLAISSVAIAQDTTPNEPLPNESLPNEPLALGSGGYNWVGDFNGDGRTDLLAILPDQTMSMRASTGSSLAVSTWEIVK